MNKTKNSMKNTNIISALKNALEGIWYAIKNERNIRIQIVIAIIAIIACIYFKVTKFEAISVIFSIALVLLGEMCNTAIENTVDLYTNEINPKAKIAKDVAAGAVLIPAINAIVIAIIVFGDKIVEMF